MDNMFISEVIKAVVKYGKCYADIFRSNNYKVVRAWNLSFEKNYLTVQVELDDCTNSTVMFDGTLSDLLVKMAKDVEVKF